ncbi:MAG: alpha-glucosidase/alpha-galactosidase [Spirochaetes bacterium GWF1_41_5]|nr:MAG: alpha-glucosidase/alpha-galactosidase [Spirochaetes bacterium GWF1_41_5]HBE04046.1 alpha-glucosidase/alpha-galactosidase [Spirochaetia bacterium]
MAKITFIGAGSFGFTRKLIRDLLTFPAFSSATFALMDIDKERLDFISQAVQKIIKEGKYPAKCISTQNREEALEGADGVVCTILQGGVDVFRHDVEIPKKYGVDINVGDTRGPAGIFRALRTIPVMLDICRDMERLCPEAWMLNYTNPMAMLCNAMQKFTKTRVTGLCHSVQGTAEMLARWIGAPREEITYLCAGINHQAFYLDFRWNGKDAYPLIRKAITGNRDIYNEEQVRNEMFLHLDYYVTESSGHNSEYNPWFRKREDLIKKYCTSGTGWNPGKYAFIRDEYADREKTWKNDIQKELDKPLDLKRSHEYAAFIFNALFGDNTPFEFNGNVPNTGIITNLPENCCVEVPVLASRRGITPMHVGALPPQLAILNNTSSRCEELAVEGALEGDARKIFHAVLFDPLTAAVLSMEETRKMTDEMFQANKNWLKQFKSI